ncbi:unnamed protein product [Pleuronectes platessa]|uniref:Uncharacterized protein n=1 Tax=Pleuronectes platessa TaxID=8262 RepID=A0A9N7VFW0_PLEPL|nr:unnamed protein product [Pleuronectes platessa]
MAALLDEDDTFIDIPGTLQASGDEEVLEVKSGDPGLQRRLMLHSGGRASGPGPSQPHATARTQFETGAGLEVEAGPEAGRMVMGSESTVKMRIAEEVIPHYTQQLRERVQPDMITLGSLSLQQQVAQEGPVKSREWATRSKKLIAFLTGNMKHLIPSHRQAGAPVILLYSEELREVARRQSEATAYYITADKIERPRKRERGGVVVVGRITESPSLRVLGEGQEEAMAKFEQMTERPGSSSSASRPMWQSTFCVISQCVESPEKRFQREDGRLPANTTEDPSLEPLISSAQGPCVVSKTA